MNTKEIEAKRDWIATYFDKMVGPKINNLDNMMNQGFIEEALTLALCYIDAIPNFLAKNNNPRLTFIKTIYDYSGQKELFSKISIWFFVINGKDSSEHDKNGTPIFHYKDIKEALIKRFDKNNNVQQEVDKDELIKYLKSNIKSCDTRNLKARLDYFSYAAVLYEWGRSSGVHSMGIFATSSKKGTSFEKNQQGEEVYYNSDRLCFSKEIIISTLKNIHQNLRKKCLDETKWPYELRGCTSG